MARNHHSRQAQTDVLQGEAAALARIQEVLDGTLPAFQSRPETGI